MQAPKKLAKNNSKLSEIASITTKSITKALTNYKKNKELEKIRIIKFQKLEEKNQILKDRKELKNWEERLIKDSNKIKLIEEELKIKEKEIKIKEDNQKIENERLIKKDENLILVTNDLRNKEKQLRQREEEQNRKDID